MNNCVLTYERDESQQDQGTDLIQHRRLYYDLRHNIESIEDMVNADRSQTFGYDALSRLTDALGRYGQLGYSYDGVGNRLTQTRTPPGASAAADSYSYPSDSHRLQSISGSGTTSLSYDAAGAVTARGGLTLAYNAAHRASSITAGAASVSSVYAATGQRIVKTAGSEQTVFHYDRSGHLIAETGIGSALVQREYVWLDDLPLLIESRITRPEAIVDNGDHRFTARGTWASSTAQAGYYGADYLAHGPAGTPTGTVLIDDTDGHAVAAGIWTPHPGINAQGGTYQSAAGASADTTFTWLPNLPEAGRYQVYARWSWNSLLDTWPAASNAPFTITHSQGPTVVRVDQRYNKDRWNLLGTYNFAQGTAQVMLSGGNAGGRIVADAVRLVPVEIDGSPAIDQVHWPAPDAATYEVYARWPASGAHSSSAGYTVEHANGIASLVKNQRADGGQWNLLGIYTFADSPDQGVTLSASPNDTVVADAVRFVPTAQSRIKTQKGFVHTDHLNTPQRLTDQAQQVLWDASYSPFGVAALLQNTMENPLRLPGQYFDAETGLHQNWMRDYDPSLGRYLQSDPIGLDGGLNTYAYANGNPLAFSDPTGENPIAVVIAAIRAAQIAVQRCAANQACRCRAMYAAYKAACGVGCQGTTCEVVTAQATVAQMCFQLRVGYIAMGCDKVIPTSRDHPGAAAQAKRAWQNCETRRAQICSCSGS